MSNTTTLEGLVGEHTLTGVDYDTDEKNDYGDYPNAMYFVLDGITYKATEDPSDGYRSCMRDIEVSDRVVKNTFAPCRVLASYVTACSYGNAEVLECRDMTTGKVVLRVGTENSDDYYPSYVAEFTPEHMAVNA